MQVYTLYMPLHKKLLTLSHAICQQEKVANINIYKCFFRHEGSSWGVRLLLHLPLQGSQEAMTVTVIYTYQASIGHIFPLVSPLPELIFTFCPILWPIRNLCFLGLYICNKLLISSQLLSLTSLQLILKIWH